MERADGKERCPPPHHSTRHPARHPETRSSGWCFQLQSAGWRLGPPKVGPACSGDGGRAISSHLSFPAGASVGSGRNGLVQFELEAGVAGMQAAVAGFADPAGFEELLAGHRHLLVTAAGAKHIPTIPWIRNRKRRKEGQHRMPACSARSNSTRSKAAFVGTGSPLD